MSKNKNSGIKFRLISFLSQNLLLSLIVIFGSILRFWFLINYKTFRFDEALTWNIGNLPFWEIVSGNYYNIRFHPPLFYLIVHLLLKISNAELWLRFPPFIASIISIMILYFLLSKWLSKKVALIATYLYATSPFTIWWSSQLRVYQLLFLFSLIYLFVYYKFIKSRSIKYLLPYTVFGIIGVHLDYSFLWLYISVFTHYLFSQKQKKKSQYLWFLGNIIILANVILYFLKIGFSPFGSRADVSYIPVPNLLSSLKLLQEFLFSERYFTAVNSSGFLSKSFFELTGWLFLLLVIKEVFIFHKKTSLLNLIIFIPLTVSFLVSQFFPIFVTKNLFFLIFGFITFLSLSIGNIIKHHKTIGYLLITLWLIVSLYIMQFFYDSEPKWFLAKQIFQNSLYASNKIVIIPSWSVDSFKYYSHKYYFIVSDEQILNEGSNIQSTNEMFEYANNKHFCVILNTHFSDDFFQKVPPVSLINMLNKYPDKVDLGGGTSIYCK